METDYLALIVIDWMTVFGRDSDLGKAIDRAKQEAKRTAKPHGGFEKGAELPVNIYDVTGHNGVRFRDQGVIAEDGTVIERLTDFKWRPTIL